MIRKGVLLPDSPISDAMLNIEGGKGYVQNLLLFFVINVLPVINFFEIIKS